MSKERVISRAARVILPLSVAGLGCTIIARIGNFNILLGEEPTPSSQPACPVGGEETLSPCVTLTPTPTESCVCPSETPTITPSRTATRRIPTATEHRVTDTPRPPSETPVTPPTETSTDTPQIPTDTPELPTATIPPTITAQGPEPTSTPNP
jgi:hypothetical protein